jgi:nucleoid-associated protein YgaU
MTRETKIGLLVGLAFIIVIGILLSDHFTTATQPHQAALTTTIDDVLGSTRTMGPRRQNAAPLDPPNVEPRGPILVQPDPSLERREHVEVGAANRGQRVIDVTEQPVIPAMPEIAQIPDVRGNSAAAEENILAHAEPVVIAPQQQVNTNTSASQSTRMYTVEAGDNLGKMASKTMGGNTKANRDAILKANPKLAENPNKINIGDVYNIPVPAATVSSNTAEVREPAREGSPPIASSSVEYVVKDGDRLSKIAREQCGSVSFVSQILEMNKDVLKGSPDKLKIGMKLKLPPKQVASR